MLAFPARFDSDQGARPGAVPQFRSMANVVFKCPRTGMNVQHWIAEDARADDPSCTYETLVCKACTRLHFINRATGKLLGDVEPQAASPRPD
jgi:hypothetical protein